MHPDNAAACLNWAISQAHFAKLVSQLKPKHIQYMTDWVEAMEAMDEYSMNRAWAKMPDSKKLADKQSRIVAELLCCYISFLQRSKT